MATGSLEFLRANAKTICRTCYQISTHLHPLYDLTEQFPMKSLADLLYDIAKIKTKPASDEEDSLPKQLCGNCSRKLKNAYTFVLKAQEINEKLVLLAQLMKVEVSGNGEAATTTMTTTTTNMTKQLDCLLESPIDIPPATKALDFVKIKMENEFVDDISFEPFSIQDHISDDHFNGEFGGGDVEKLATGEADEDDDCTVASIKRQIIGRKAEELKEEHGAELHGGNDVEEQQQLKIDDPIKTEAGKRTLRSSIADTDYENDCNDDSDSDWEKTSKRRGVRKRKKLSDSKGRYTCEECGKTFAWKKDLKRHALSHKPSPAFQCDLCDRSFLRKDKLNDHLKVHQRRSAIAAHYGDKPSRHPEWNFAERIYSEKPLKRVECKLCNTEFPTIQLLRSHLQSHTSIASLQILTTDSEVVKALNSQPMQKLDDVKAQICEDIKEQLYGKFYSILNGDGYEMSLSDTDVDQGELAQARKYHCELCGEEFTRKFDAFRHLKEKHAHDKIPYKCIVCKVEFVCRKLFDEHTRAQCRNKEKKYQCLKCPGKFMWLANLDAHNCSNRFNSVEYKSQLPKKRALLQCDLCDKTFISRKDLKRHIESHESNGSNSSHECNICSQRFAKVDSLKLHYKQAHAQLGHRIECCLCGMSFRSLKQLRAHLPQHADGTTGIDHEHGLFFKCFQNHCDSEQPVDNHQLSSELAKKIANDFEKQTIARFYIAVDESGNELDVEQSETETESDSTVGTVDKRATYKCEICGQVFERKKTILGHQLAEHGHLDMLPHACEHCNKQFVCAELLQRHMLCDCGNIYKKWHCTKCDARFVWEQNLQMHMSLKHFDQEQQLDRKVVANKLQCDDCDKTFIWPKDLNRHKRCHMPDDEKFECPLCPRRFNRKDNMQAHVKIHGAAAGLLAVSKRDPTKCGKQNKVKGVDEYLCRPNGCKLVQCMICLSKHSKIADLRTHLRTHQYVISLAQRGHNEDIGDISLLFYPNEAPMNTEVALNQRIMADISAQDFERFYSITNEFGYELNLSDSETESDSELEQEVTSASYACDLCERNFDRKYKLFEHQKYSHEWCQLPHYCEICDARFASEQFLQRHLKAQCRNKRKRFVCRKCPMQFMWKDNLKTHERIMHPEKDEAKKKTDANRYECEVCHQTFAWQKDLTRHAILHQPEAKIYKCLWCPRRFYRKDKLNMHIKRHNLTPQCIVIAESQSRACSGPNGNKEIYCKVCDLKFLSIFSLRSHLMEVEFENVDLPKSSEQQIEPQHYELNSYLNYSITNHIGFELHLDDSETDGEGVFLPKAEGTPPNYTCELCQVEYLRKYEVMQHQSQVHSYEQLPYKCDKCIFKTVSQDILDYHMRTQCLNTEKQFQCSICLHKFMWQENLHSHIQLMHPKEVEDTKSEKGLTRTKAQKPVQRTYQCELCKCKYNRKDRLNAHIKKVHIKGEDGDQHQNDGSEIDPATGEQVQKQPMEKKYLCAFCGRAVTSSSNLIIHMRRHTGEKPFKCDFCDMAFPRSSDLQCHRRTHTGEKPHKCTVCEKAFSRSYKLQTHMRIHSGERPYKCTYCEKSFTQSNDLTLHIRRHTGERPYVCGICGERFIQGTALKNHRTMRGHYEDVQPRKMTVLERF